MTDCTTPSGYDPSAAHPPLSGGVVPHLSLGDASAAVEFYKRAFAAEELQRLPAEDGRRLMHCHIRINGGSVMLADAFPEYGYPLQAPAGYTLHLQVDDIEAWWARAVEAGATVVMPLENMFWGDRYGRLTDPFGVEWSLGMPIR
ncbi:VOC family protein [Azospirillum doebereinerae]